MKPSEHGVVLVAVLWALALLTIMATAMSASVRIETALARNQVDATVARLAAEEAITRTILRLGVNDIAQAGIPELLEVGAVRVQIDVTDEAGKIDLNHAGIELLQGILSVAGFEVDERDRVADAILDWRDADDLRRFLGAEEPDYAAQGLNYGPKNGNFDTVDELQQVLGMDPVRFRKIEPYLTIYSGEAGVNPQVAAAAVLRALPGVEEEQALAYERAKRDGLPVEGILPPVDAGYLARQQGVTHTIEALAESRSGVRSRTVAVVRLQHRNAAEVLRWQESLGAARREQEVVYVDSYQ